MTTPQLNDTVPSALMNAAGNLVSVGRYDGTFGAPPTQSERQSFAVYVKDLRQALLR